MANVLVCGNGIELELLSENGLWATLRQTEGDRALEKFAIDSAELRATLRGDVSFQVMNGAGSSATFDTSDGTLRVRLEIVGHPAKQCRLDAKALENALESIGS